METKEVPKKAEETLSDKELLSLFDKIIKDTQAEMSDAFDNFLKQWKRGSMITAENPRCDVSTDEKKIAFLKEQYEKAKAKVMERDAKFSNEYGKYESTPEDIMRQLLTDIDYLTADELVDKKKYAKEYKYLKDREKISKGTKMEMEKLGVKTAEHIVFEDDGKTVKGIETPKVQEKNFVKYTEQAIGRKLKPDEEKIAEEIKNKYALSMFIDREGKLREGASPKSREEILAKRKYAYTKEAKTAALPGKNEKWISFLIQGPDHPVFPEIKEQLNAVATDDLDKFEETLEKGEPVKLVYNRDKLPILLKKKSRNEERFEVYTGVGENKQKFEVDKYFAGLLFENYQTDPSEIPLLFALGMDYRELAKDGGAEIYLANKTLLKNTYKEKAGELFA